MNANRLTHIIFDYRYKGRECWVLRHEYADGARSYRQVSADEAARYMKLYAGRLEEVDTVCYETIYKVTQPVAEPSPVDVFMPAGVEVVR